MQRRTQSILENLKNRLSEYVPDPKYKHDSFIILCLQQAFIAAEEGNFGVGAILVDNSEGSILHARNKVFHPYFRTDRHAEMEVITEFEMSSKGAVVPASHTLFSSLEPCPMCLTRILISGVGTTFYAAANEAGGMGGLLGHLPHTLQRYAEQKVIGPADCSPVLRSIAWQIFEINTTDDSERLMSTRDTIKPQQD